MKKHWKIKKMRIRDDSQSRITKDKSRDAKYSEPGLTFGFTKEGF